MKKTTYEKPMLTVVSFRAERGYAGTGEKTFSLEAMFGGGSTEAADTRATSSSDTWGSW